MRKRQTLGRTQGLFLVYSKTLFVDSTVTGN